jgi:hypothetical protein
MKSTSAKTRGYLLKLEKTNETIWSIKRKGYDGKFILRSTETGGHLEKVAIALAEEQGTEITFNMNVSEFRNFYNILSSFKDLIESPEHLAAGQTTIEEIPILTPKVKNTHDLDLQGIAESLETLDLGLTAKNSIMTFPNRDDITAPKLRSEKNIDKKPRSFENNNIPNSLIPVKEKKEILKETDWDPW